MSNSNGKENVLLNGRIVWASGDLFKGKPQFDKKTNQPIRNKVNEQSITYGFGLAVPKLVNGQPNPELANFFGACQAEAMQLYPQHIPPAFAWKVKDGDGVDDKGILLSTRDGYAHHWIFALTTNLPIRYFRWDQNTRGNMQINTGVKVGDYVQVAVTMKAHGPLNNGAPGMYLNPTAVQLTGIGTAIVSQAANADSIFGAAAPSTPMGGQMLTAENQPASIPFGAPGMSQQHQMPGQFQAQMPPQQQQFQPPQQPVAPAPNYGVVPQVHQPQVQQQVGFQQPVQQQPFGQPPMGQPAPQFQQPFNQQQQMPQQGPPQAGAMPFPIR